MSRSTINTSLLYLSGGFMFIGFYEIITKGLGVAYIWIMIGFMLWMWYGIRRRQQKMEEEDKQTPEKPARKAPVSKSGRKRR